MGTTWKMLLTQDKEKENTVEKEINPEDAVKSLETIANSIKYTDDLFYDLEYINNLANDFKNIEETLCALGGTEENLNAIKEMKKALDALKAYKETHLLPDSNTHHSNEVDDNNNLNYEMTKEYIKKQIKLQYSIPKKMLAILIFFSCAVALTVMFFTIQILTNITIIDYHIILVAFIANIGLLLTSIKTFKEWNQYLNE